MGCSHHGASCDLLWCWIVYSTGEAPFHLSCRIPAWSSGSIRQLMILRLEGWMWRARIQEQQYHQSGIVWKL